MTPPSKPNRSCTSEAATAATVAATAAAYAAAATVQAFTDLSGKIERGHDKIFGKLDAVVQNQAELVTRFAVHVESAKREEEKIEKHEQALHGSNGIVRKVERLWAIDQVKVWAIRGLTGTALFVLGYGVKHWLGW